MVVVIALPLIIGYQTPHIFVNLGMTTNFVHFREVSTVMRYLGAFPSERDIIKKILPEVSRPSPNDYGIFISAYKECKLCRCKKMNQLLLSRTSSLKKSCFVVYKQRSMHRILMILSLPLFR